MQSKCSPIYNVDVETLLDRIVNPETSRCSTSDAFGRKDLAASSLIRNHIRLVPWPARPVPSLCSKRGMKYCSEPLSSHVSGPDKSSHQGGSYVNRAGIAFVNMIPKKRLHVNTYLPGMQSIQRYLKGYSLNA